MVEIDEGVPLMRGDSREHVQANREAASPRDRDLLISVEHGLLLRVGAAAILLGIGRTMMYDLIRRGEIPTVKTGRRTLVHRDDLELFARNRREE